VEKLLHYVGSDLRICKRKDEVESGAVLVPEIASAVVAASDNVLEYVLGQSFVGRVLRIQMRETSVHALLKKLSLAKNRRDSDVKIRVLGAVCQAEAYRELQVDADEDFLQSG
jgi:hypothetical protein